MPPQSAYAKPLPQPTALTKPFWAHCRQHELWLQCCLDCGKYRFYPTASCPFCASEDTEWRRVSGRGSIYSWIVVHRAIDPAWEDAVPFTVAVVELAEQPHLLVPGILTTASGTPVAAAAGMPVEVWFDDVTPEIALPRWRATTE